MAIFCGVDIYVYIDCNYIIIATQPLGMRVYTHVYVHMPMYVTTYVTMYIPYSYSFMCMYA